MTGGGLPVAMISAGVALLVLGYDATYVAIYLGVVAKGARVLKELRNHYREVEFSEAHLVLKRK